MAEKKSNIYTCPPMIEKSSFIIINGGSGSGKSSLVKVSNS